MYVFIFRLLIEAYAVYHNHLLQFLYILKQIGILQTHFLLTQNILKSENSRQTWKRKQLQNNTKQKPVKTKLFYIRAYTKKKTTNLSQTLLLMAIHMCANVNAPLTLFVWLLSIAITTAKIKCCSLYACFIIVVIQICESCMCFFSIGRIEKLCASLLKL